VAARINSRGSSPTPSCELAKSADLNPGTVTVMLDQLETRGIVQRDRMARDRRVCVVSLTDQGRAILQERHAHWQAMWEARFGDLTESELAAALHVLRKMIDLLDEL
jgi:DNA-binding MarR family transcriptional regulator